MKIINFIVSVTILALKNGVKDPQVCVDSPKSEI